ncbi:hypothetical protein JTB14_034875 [Gonioctena quinquepunctata]|nr:hypothetical protein JTB14_034875 [Gonioctena quinquepunctata]
MAGAKTILSVREFHSWKTLLVEKCYLMEVLDLSFRSFRLWPAKSLVNIEEEDVAQIHGEVITEDSVTLDEVSPLSSFFQDWQVKCGKSIVVLLLVERGQPFREFSLNIIE